MCIYIHIQPYSCVYMQSIGAYFLIYTHLCLHLKFPLFSQQKLCAIAIQDCISGILSL